jgi:hypothetical protein
MVGVRSASLICRPTRPAARWASRWTTALLPYRFGFGPTPPIRWSRSAGAAAADRHAARSGGGRGESVLWQPLLQPAHPAAGDLSAQRRIPAPRGSAGRGRSPDPHRRGNASRPLPICRSSARVTRTCRITLPHVAQAVSAPAGRTRSASAAWCCPIRDARRLPGKGQLQRKRVCRTFSDCTTAPRGGLVSGCYPLDEYYKELPEYDQLKDIKQPG